MVILLEFDDSDNLYFTWFYGFIPWWSWE